MPSGNSPHDASTCGGAGECGECGECAQGDEQPIDPAVRWERIDRLIEAARAVAKSRARHVRCHDEFDGPDGTAACQEYEDDLFSDLDIMVERVKRLDAMGDA